jgi:Cap4 dsDNA endonuclease
MSEATTETSKKRRRSGTATVPSPVNVRDTKDPGDSTQQNFRYQHCYGVMLLIAAKVGKRPYIALWCEQHEDFLAERADKKFDGFQIKTSRPENGAWRLGDREFKRAIERFTDLVAEYGDSLQDLYFVSNTEVETVGPQNSDDRRRALCPGLFLEHIKSCSKPADVSGVFRDSFFALQADFGCTPDLLFEVLQRVHIVLGPSRREMEAALSHEHLAQLDSCKTLNAVMLNGFRDYLVQKVFGACSLQVEDPVRHLRPVFSRTEIDPALVAKRLLVETTIIYTADDKPPVFQYIGDVQLRLGEPRPAHVLKQKLEAGGIGDELDYMRERERSAERHLLEDVVRRPERYPELLKQVEQVVIGECREAHLRARNNPAPYGSAMMIDVQNRLRRIAAEETALIGDHSYECLIGMAGLLTSDCLVWWSPRFTIENGADA